MYDHVEQCGHSQAIQKESTQKGKVINTCTLLIPLTDKFEGAGRVRVGQIAEASPEVTIMCNMQQDAYRTIIQK